MSCSHVCDYECVQIVVHNTAMNSCDIFSVIFQTIRRCMLEAED